MEKKNGNLFLYIIHSLYKIPRIQTQPKEIAKHTIERNHFGEFCSLTFVIKTPPSRIRDQAGPDIRLLK